MPAPDKDYRTITEPSSNRNLERMQGYRNEVEYKKREVVQEVPPAEVPKHVSQTAHRRNNLQMNSRDTFFNQTHVQDLPDMDVKRKDMYDGYNVKTRHCLPIEHSWRDQHTRPVARRQEPTKPSPKVEAGQNKDRMRRQEVAPVYARNPIKTPMVRAVSAKNARLSLPLIPEATLRASPTVERQVKDASHNQSNARILQDQEHTGSDAMPAITPASSLMESNLHIPSRGDAPALTKAEEQLLPPQGASTQVAMLGSAFHREKVDVTQSQREEVLVPLSSPEYAIASRIAEEVHLAGGDDSEVTTILQTPRQVHVHVPTLTQGNADHIHRDTNVTEHVQTVPSGAMVASRVASQPVLGHSDVVDIGIEHVSTNPWIRADAVRPEAQATGSDAHDVDPSRVDVVPTYARVSEKVELHRNDVSVAPEARPVHVLEAKSARSAKISVLGADVQSVDRTLYDGTVQVSASGLTSHESELPSLRQGQAPLPIANPMGSVKSHIGEVVVDEERTYAPHPVAKDSQNSSNKRIDAAPQTTERIEHSSFARENHAHHSWTRVVDSHSDHALPERAASVPLPIAAGGRHATQMRADLRPVAPQSLGVAGTTQIYRPTPKRVYTPQPYSHMHGDSDTSSFSADRSIPGRLTPRQGSSTRVTPTVQFSSQREGKFRQN